MLKNFPTIIFVILFVALCTYSQNGATISSDDLLKLRNLQYEQAKYVIRMQDLRTEFDKVSSDNEKVKAQIDAWIIEQAKKQNIDLTKYRFDSDQLKFVEIKAND